MLKLRTGILESVSGRDYGICGLLLIFSLIIWWPSRYYPYFWDSAGYVIQTAQDFLSKSPLNLISPYTNFAHPPLIPGFLALIWKIFGTSQLTSHLFMFPFLPILLISTYFLFRKYLSSFFALFGTALIAFSPAVLAEYFNIYVDLPTAALTLLSLCLFSKKKTTFGFLFFSLAVMSKLPVITLLPFVFFSLKPKQRWLTLIPLLLIVIWLTYHKSVTGWLLVEPIRDTSIPKNFSDLISAILYVLEIFFINQGRWIWTVLLFITTIYLLIKKKLSIHHLFYYPEITTSLIASLVFFIIVSEFAPRYSLYFLPLYSLLLGLIIQKLYVEAKLSHPFILITALILPLVQVLSWRGSIEPTKNYEFNPPADFSIIDYLRVFRELSATLEVMGLKSKIYGGFPEIQMLTEPIQGYVSKPLDFTYCEKFIYQPDQTQLIIVHPYAPSQIPCRSLLDSFPTTRLQHFEKNGKWIELYQINATNSASAKKT